MAACLSRDSAPWCRNAVPHRRHLHRQPREADRRRAESRQDHRVRPADEPGAAGVEAARARPGEGQGLLVGPRQPGRPADRPPDRIELPPLLRRPPRRRLPVGRAATPRSSPDHRGGAARRDSRDGARDPGAALRRGRRARRPALGRRSVGGPAAADLRGRVGRLPAGLRRSRRVAGRRARRDGGHAARRRGSPAGRSGRSAAADRDRWRAGTPGPCPGRHRSLRASGRAAPLPGDGRRGGARPRAGLPVGEVDRLPPSGPAADGRAAVQRPRARCRVGRHRQDDRGPPSGSAPRPRPSGAPRTAGDVLGSAGDRPADAPRAPDRPRTEDRGAAGSALDARHWAPTLRRPSRAPPSRGRR